MQCEGKQSSRGTCDDAAPLSLPPHTSRPLSCLAFDLPFCSKPPKPKPSDTFVCLGVSCLSWGGRGFCVRPVCTCAPVMDKASVEGQPLATRNDSLANLFFRDLAHPHHALCAHIGVPKVTAGQGLSHREGAGRDGGAQRGWQRTHSGEAEPPHRASKRHTTRTI